MGILILFMMIVYIAVSYFIVRVIYKFTNKKTLSIVLFIGLITFPFWDLIAQKAIKTYYINSGLLEPKIYAMPEKDKNGKIENLSLEKVTKEIESWLNKGISTKKLLVKYYNFTENSALQSLDLRFQYGKYPDYTYKIVRCSYDQTTKMPITNYLDKSDARYKIEVKTNNKLLGLYELEQYQVVDTKTNKVLSESFGIGFPDELYPFGYIRRHLLVLMTGNGLPMAYVSGLGYWAWGDLLEIFDLKFENFVKKQ